MKSQIKTLLEIATILIIMASLTGCTSIDEIINDGTSFEELHGHLGKYINKEVTIEGYIGEIMPNFDCANFYDSPSSPYYVIMLDNISSMDVYRGWYKITGIVEKVENDVLFVYTCTIDVTSVEAQ